MVSAYSPEQIAQYLKAVGLPAHYHPDAPNPRPRDADLLQRLHVHQISTIPYENLSLHYKHPATISSVHNHHTASGAWMNLDPQYLFHKFVTGNHGRGGYCFQIVTFFAHILRGMGFKQTYTAQARIRLRDPTTGVPNGDYIGFRHAVNIVTLDDGTRWDLDVSFGGDGPISPLQLIHGRITQNIGAQQLRLIKDYIPEQYDMVNPQKLWIYQYRNGATNADGSERPWNSYYAFPELEAVTADLEVCNWHTSQYPGSFQTQSIICVKFLGRDGSRAGDSGKENDITSQGENNLRRRIYGKMMLAGNVLKRNTGGRTEIITICNSEIERLNVLKEHFNITLFPEEITGILGGISELKAAVAAA